MGTLFASYRTENVGEVMSLLNLVRLPSSSSAGLHPYLKHAGVGQTIALISPLTYAHDLILFAFNGTTRYGPVADIAVLVLALAVFQIAGALLYQRSRE